MPSRGFSLLAGLIAVAVATALLSVPIPLRRVGAHLAHAEFAVFARGLDAVSNHLSLGAITRAAQRTLARHRRAVSLPRPFAASPEAAPHASAWATLAPGVRYRVVAFTAASGEAMKLHQVAIDPRVAELRVAKPSAPAAVAMIGEETRAWAALNACYFDEARRPLGYLKIGGRVVNGDVATGAAFTAMFALRGQRASIIPRAAFDGRTFDTALQAGPRLVADGYPTRGLRETRSFRQSGVAVTREGHIVLYATDGSYRGATWAEMQRILTGASRAGGIDPRDVLNLDGGSSSQVYVRAPSGRVMTGFPTPVPVMLTVHAR